MAICLLYFLLCLIDDRLDAYNTWLLMMQNTRYVETNHQ
jgi:hypothetical protein